MYYNMLKMTLMFIKSVEDSGAQIQEVRRHVKRMSRVHSAHALQCFIRTPGDLSRETSSHANSIGSVVQRNITSLPRDAAPAHVAICCAPFHGLQSKISLISLRHRVIKLLSYCCTISSPMKTVSSYPAARAVRIRMNE